LATDGPCDQVFFGFSWTGGHPLSEKWGWMGCLGNITLLDFGVPPGKKSLEFLSAYSSKDYSKNRANLF
jgi:hypothetical protein